MNQIAEHSILDQLFLAIENDELVLPTMPELAIKLQRMLDDINVSSHQIELAISSDPVIAAQLIRTANSAAFGDKPKVGTVMAAISRLGYRLLRNLVLTITMVKLSNVNHPVIKKHIAKFWEHSREVAAISYVLAKHQKHLNPDQAMLAGLVHDIGTLPLCLHAEKMFANLDDATLGLLVRKFRAQFGERLLRAWEFPLELIEVIIEHEDFQRESDSPHASYSDIVTVANMLNRETVKITKWENIASVKRLWLSPEFCQQFFDQFDQELRAAREMLA